MFSATLMIDSVSSFCPIDLILFLFLSIWRIIPLNFKSSPNYLLLCLKQQDQTFFNFELCFRWTKHKEITDTNKAESG